MIGLYNHSPARLLGILFLICILIPAGLAVDPLWIVPASPGLELSTVALSHDGSTIIAGGDQLIVLQPDGTKLWSAWSGTLLDVSDNGNYIVTSQGQTVRLFNRQGIMLWDRPLGETVTDLSLSPDAAMVAAGGGITVQSWYNSGSGLGKNLSETVRDIKISPVKDQIIVTTSKALRSFNLSYVPNWFDDSISPGTVELSGDGTGIVIPNGNHIRMYHGSGTLLLDRAFPGGTIISLAYSRDGSTIVAGRDDGTVIVLGREGTLLWTGKAGYWVTSVCVSDDGSTIATGSIDNQIHVFDRQGTVLGSFLTQGPVKSRSVAVSGDGSLVVAVDTSAVYGFSRSRLTLPVTPSVKEGMGNILNGTSHDNATLVTMVSGAGTTPLLSVNASVPVTGTTPSAGFLWILAPVSLALIILARKK